MNVCWPAIGCTEVMTFVEEDSPEPVVCGICSMSPVSGLSLNATELDVPISTAVGLMYEFRKSDIEPPVVVASFVFVLSLVFELVAKAEPRLVLVCAVLVERLHVLPLQPYGHV